ncbi:MAG: hypothetical protein QOH67_2858 [Hyphomicrobiales bacterium]|nr:hypothetical protein [Hyphomicrobiales bacterium]
MKRIIAAAVIMVAMPSIAWAQDRAGPAALGALSGAVVLGPVGLVAGAVVGYTAGPSIAQSWRNSRHHPRSQARATKRPARVASRQRSGAPATPPPGEVTPAQPAPGTGGPPAQGLE